MVTLDLLDHRVPEDQEAHRVTVDHLDHQETLVVQEPQARRATKEKMEAQDFQDSWVPVGLQEKQER